MGFEMLIGLDIGIIRLVLFSILVLGITLSLRVLFQVPEAMKKNKVKATTAFVFAILTIIVASSQIPLYQPYDGTTKVEYEEDDLLVKHEFADYIVNITNPKMLEGIPVIRAGEKPILKEIISPEQAGHYNLISSNIFVERQERPYVMHTIYIHELAHHIWWSHFNSSTRSEYKQIADENPDGFPTSYARTDTSEDFAESFLYSVINAPHARYWREDQGVHRLDFIAQSLKDYYGCEQDEVYPSVVKCVFPDFYKERR